MSTNTRVRTKTQRKIFEKTHQRHTEYLWKSLQEVMNIDIFKGVFTLSSDEEIRTYLAHIESLFIQKARNNKVPKNIILKSNAFNCMKQVTRRRDLNPSNFRRVITQLETCASRKVKHARLTVDNKPTTK